MSAGESSVEERAREQTRALMQQLDDDCAPDWGADRGYVFELIRGALLAARDGALREAEGLLRDAASSAINGPPRRLLTLYAKRISALRAGEKDPNAGGHT